MGEALNIITLDFETFFSDDYSLSKMTTESYIRDPRFEAHGCAVGYLDYKYAPQDIRFYSYWVPNEKLTDYFASVNWNDCAILCHHAQFDGLILSHHYGVKPRAWLDTLSMARLLLGNHLSVSLDSLAKHYRLAAKTVPYNLFRGKHWAELDPAVQRLVSSGACHDVELTWQLFQILAKDFPKDEYRVVDATIRMFTEPVLRADVPLLAKIWEREANNKTNRLALLNVSEADLQSADKFAALLRAEGVEPETKNGKKKEIYCFAKTDRFMNELLEDENDRIRTLAEARLGVKSTLLQTRSETYGWMAKRGNLCIYLNYAGSHTSRFSGGDKSNFQNGVPELNAAILPPEGYILIKPDASQIECRLLNFISGQTDVVEAFREGRDVYAEKASAFYGRTITKTTDPIERQIFKVVELQAGYGSGAKKIQTSIRVKSAQAGFDITVSDEQGELLKNNYRTQHPFVMGYWKQAENVLARISYNETFEWGPYKIHNKRIWLPNGIPLIYESLNWHVDDETGDRFWRRKTRNGWEKMYGAKLVENVIQAIARLCVTQAMLRIQDQGLRTRNMRHDDLWICIPQDGQEHRYMQMCVEELSREPTWLPGIPLAAEVN